jgi:hypothetical protein
MHLLLVDGCRSCLEVRQRAVDNPEQDQPVSGGLGCEKCMPVSSLSPRITIACKGQALCQDSCVSNLVGT